MTDADRDDAPVDSGEAGNFVDPVDLGGGRGDELGTDPAADKGDFTSSTDPGTGGQGPANVDRVDGDYTTTETHTDEAAGEGDYTDQNDTSR